MKASLRLLAVVLSLLLLFTQCEKEEQLVNLNEPYFTITDQAFLNALIDEGVDINGDGLISDIEAKAIISLDVHDKGIHDMTGLEAFVNLEYLHCSYNPITSLNVSNSKNLRILDCEFSKLTALDVSQNTKLTELGLSGDYLTSLDVTNNVDLVDLDLTGNLFSTLDVSNNDKLKRLNVDDMPSLGEICVWNSFIHIDCYDQSYEGDDPDIVCVNERGSPNAYFTTDCSQ